MRKKTDLLHLLVSGKMRLDLNSLPEVKSSLIEDLRRYSFSKEKAKEGKGLKNKLRKERI